MKPYILSLLFLLGAVISNAKPSVSKSDAYKAVAKLVTYNAQGALLSTSTAVFINGNGEAVTAYSNLEKAHHAEVYDFKGKKYDVLRILGANATTDLIKFSVKANKPFVYLSIAQDTASVGNKLQLLSYSTAKVKKYPVAEVIQSEPFNHFCYYHVTVSNDSANIACPLVDESMNLVAFVQKNVEKDATTACAIDARFVDALTINATSAFNTDLTALSIPRTLPSSLHDATTYLYMLSTADSVNYISACNDFIASYPNMPNGYMSRGSFFGYRKQYEKAKADFALAKEKAAAVKNDSNAISTDAIHYAYSNLIYKTVMAEGRDSICNEWNLATAETEANKAYALSNNALYLVQKGNCQYAARRYMEASESFKQACNDKHFVSAETFFSAARSLELAKGNNNEVIALLDSCIAHIPSKQEAKYAQFYFERSQRLIKAEKYREAVNDLNQYESLIGPKHLSEQFYDLRSQAEVQAHMYQQALDDLNTAIAVSKSPYPYQTEQIVLLLNIGEFNSALTHALSLTKAYPGSGEAYKLLGIAYGELKQPVKAQQALNKAKTLGDESVDVYIKKYQK